jgi:outer membrane lipoprotein-sorting protein
MKKLSILLLAVFSLILLVNKAYAEELTVDEIVDRMDRLYRSDTSSAVVEMEIVSEHWRRTLNIDIWSEGLDKTFMHINSPKKDAGIATLRINNEMWNYLPKINKVMKVPPSMMMSSWMGSDFTNDDLVKESSLREDYDAKIIEPEGSDPDNFYVELIPKEDIPIVWARLVFAVKKDNYMPLWEAYYDEKGRKMRLMEFTEPKEFSGRLIPSVLIMTPLNKPEKKTVIKYIELEFDVELKPDVFTLRNLQRKR